MASTTNEKTLYAQGLMNMRLGRIGLSEGTAAAATALTVSGIFTFETKRLYENGNSTYLTLPLAVLVSLALFHMVAAMMKASGSRNLGELIKRAFGGFFSPLSSLVLLLLMVYAAYVPLGQFVRAMHGLFFEGVSYSKIVVFLMPAVLALALLGFETIGRSARFFALALFVVLAMSTAASFSEFEAYRLYPLFGNGAKEIAVQTVEGVGTFLPALLCLLINADGLNGLKTAKRAGTSSALIAAAVMLLAQLALALVYTYKELGELFMPMFRINYLNKFEAHFMRMDKLAHMIWLCGGMIAGAYYIYSGSRLFSQSFDIRDIRPPTVCAAVLAMLMIMVEVESKNSAAFERVKAVLNEYGFVLLAVPVLLAGMLAAVRKERSVRDERNLRG